MKHTPKIIIILIISAFIYSCKKSGSSSGGINGTWYLTRDSVKYYTGSTLNAVIGTAYSRIYSIQFNANGTGSFRTDTIAGSLSFNYKLSGSNLTLTYPAQTYDGRSQVASADTAGIGLLTSSNLELIYKGVLYNVNGGPGAYESDIYYSK